MAKKMRKVLAVLMALALCAGQLAIPAAASETEPQIIHAEVNVTVTDLGTTTQQLDTGEQLETGSTTTQWSEVTPEGAVIEGSETRTEFVGSNPESGYVLYEGGTVEGSETETHTISGEESTTETGVILSDTTEITGDASETAASTTTQEGQWTEAQHQEGQWIEGQTVEGDYVADASQSREEETTTAIDLEEPAGEVTINMTPNAGETNVTKEITLEDLVQAIIQVGEEQHYTSEITDENGETVGSETVTQKNITDENGNIVGSETETVVTMKSEEKQTDTVRDTVNEYEAVGEAVLPEGVTAGTETIYGENGESLGTVETVIEEICNDDGTVVGYKIIKTTTTSTLNETVEESTEETASEEAAPVTTIRLPEKPASSETVDEATGNKTVVQVNELLDEDGNITGYEILTTVTDAEGNEISSGTEKRYGTLVTTTETKVTDPTTVKTTVKNETVTTEITEISTTGSMQQIDTVTTRLNEFINTQMTEKRYDYIEIDGNLYFIYTGEMTVTEGAEHGDTDGMLPIQPDSSLFRKNDSKDLASGGDLYSDDANRGANIPDDGFKLVGNGIKSSLTIGTSDGSSTVTQFKLSNDAGKTFYAMCVDLSTYTQSGYFYDIEDITNQSYYQTDEGSDVAESAEKIRTIALNGFWGTPEGIGSMAEVKSLLTEYLKAQGKSESEIKGIVDSLTEGQALAATQAALWEYGAKDGSDQINENNLVTNGWDSKWNYRKNGWEYTKNEDYTNTEYLYKALLAEANNPEQETAENEGVEFLDAADVTSGSITLKEKTYDSPDGPDTYNTDISFSLAIEPRKLNGDLVVNVIVDGREVESYRLTDSDVLLPFGRIEPNADGSYTIENVELKEGVVVTLNLAGTQDLGSGVYIYTSEIKYEKKQPISSQTLVGLATGERKVDIDINMKFNVEEPEGEARQVSGSTVEGGTITDTRTDVKTDSKVSYKTDVTTTTSSSSRENGSVRTQAYADVTITESVTETTETERSWEDSWLNVFEPEPTEPEPTEPEPTEPEPTEPEPTEPEPTEPEPTEPEPTEPEPTEPEPTEPEPTEPEPTEPEPTEPEPTEPEPTEPEPTEPEPTEPEPTEPEPTEPEPTEPEPIESEPLPVEPQPEPIPIYDPGYPVYEPTPDGEVEIPDEEVPLAAAPKTGDISQLWAVISAASLGGVVLLNRKRREEE